jgi:hypothetical protein
MAIFGDLGKAFGLGTAKQTFQGAAQGALRGAIMGQPFMGAVSGAAMSGRTQFSQGTAVSTPRTPPAETASSGESGISSDRGVLAPTYMPSAAPASMIAPPLVPRRATTPTQANLPAIVGGAVGATRSIGGMLGLAGGAIMVAPTIIDMVTGEEKKLRVTRRLRSQVKQAVQMFGAEVVAENMGTSVEVVFYILTKKMRNDGSYVTKAAVRKTRQTVRKMKHLCDMYDDLRPPARRAPARRSTTSKVMQIKN